MNVARACQIINSIIYKPGWTLSAQACDRFEDGLTLHLQYMVPDFSKENAPDYQKTIRGEAMFTLMVHPSMTEDGFIHQVFSRIMEAEQHEAREAFRIAPMMDAPFHPHRHDGIERWGNRHGDLTFGLA